MPEIKVSTKGSSEVYDENTLKTYVSPGSYSYINDKYITRFRGSSVGDFLSGIPSVIVGNKRNSGALSINIRGIANENRIPVLVDNGLQSIPSWQGYAGSSTRVYLDPDLMSQIEIEKGPSLEADGTGATAGVVRMNTIGWKDIIPEGKTWGFRVRLGTMTNTVSPPALYTRGGYQAEFVKSCDGANTEGLCKPTTYAPNARYSSGFDLNSYNGSIAFAKKWDNADIVLAYAQRKQGNYFAGKHGNLPHIVGFAEDESEIEVVPGIPGVPYSAEEEDITKGITVFSAKDEMLYRAGEEVLNTFQRNKSYLVKVNLYNDHHRLGLGYRRYHSEFGELMPSQNSFRGSGALQGEGTEVKVDSYSVNYQYNPANPYINFNANAYYTLTDSSNYTPFFEALSVTKSSFYAYFTLSRQQGITLSNRSVFTVNNRPFTLNYGVSYSEERIKRPKDAYQRAIAKGYPDDAIAPKYIRDGERKEKSAFISLNYPVTDWLKVDAGLRYIDTKVVDNRPIEGEQTINTKPLSQATQEELANPFGTGLQKKIKIYTPSKPIKVRAFSPIVMLTVEPIKGVQLYAKYAQAVRAPSLFQGTQGFSMQHAENLDKLKAERAKNWEFGIHTLFENVLTDHDVLSTKLTYFHNVTKDYLTRTASKINSSVDQTSNIESAKFKGFEISAYYDMQRFYTKLAATYYTSTEFCVTPEQQARLKRHCFTAELYRSNLSNQIPPRLTAHVTIGSRWLDNKLDLGARYSYYGERLTSVNPDRGNPDATPVSVNWKPYALVDLYASYQVTKDFALNWGMDNVFNRYYLDANNMGRNPAPGRTMHFGIDYRF